MNNCFSRYNIVYGVLLVALIMVAEAAVYYLKLPAWPMMAPLVLFFLGHLDTKNVPAIFVGGLVGIACSVLIVPFAVLLAPVLGSFVPKLIFIGLFVFAIVLFKDAIPVVFNSYAFMIFMMAAMVHGTTAPSILAVIMLLGGGFVIGGTVIIHRKLEPIKPQ